MVKSVIDKDEDFICKVSAIIRKDFDTKIMQENIAKIIEHCHCSRAYYEAFRDPQILIT